MTTANLAAAAAAIAETIGLADVKAKFIRQAADELAGVTDDCVDKWHLESATLDALAARQTPLGSTEIWGSLMQEAAYST